MTERVQTATLSWRQIERARDRGAAVIVPMGSTEEHGPHAPTGDYLIAEHIATMVASNTNDLVTPVIPFSYSEYFRHYPGTITVQAETLRLVVRDTIFSLLDQGFRHVILFNGHKGNEPVLSLLMREIRRERGHLVPYVAPLGFGLTPDLQLELYGSDPIGHGAEPIGSLASFLLPDYVDLDQAEDWETRPFLGMPPSGLNGVEFEGRQVGMAVNMGDITPPSGSLSDPTVADAEKGKLIVDNAVASLTRFVEWFKSINPTIEP